MVTTMANDIAKQVLIGGPERREIRLRDYDPRWATIFKRHAAIIAHALGSAALRIEHVGSTAVPGLAAKPIVDVLLIVADSSDEPAYLAKMEAAGYVLRVREPAYHEHRMFRTPELDVHVHVFSRNSAEAARMLRFRDRLRASAADRRLYEDTKRRLAAQAGRI
jgi:GrpB-like predicted nucleotidyltransferase (UPF0157 family)